ncbi:MAG: outer membrane beta-barrel protein [Rhodospirillaceae bacterium]|nr:outer membrane beta-barrel protein [Rhodospirillaceae bacterium]
MRLPAAFSFFAASLMAIAPFQAIAQETTSSVAVQDRSRPEYDPVGRRLGGFDLNAQLDLTAVATDNVYATEVNEESDTYFVIRPSMRLDSHWSRNALGVNAGATQTLFNSFDTENATTGYVGGYGRLDIGSRSDVGANFRISREVEDRTSLDTITFGKPVTFNVKDAAVTVGHRFNQLQLRGTFDRASYDYHNQDGLTLDLRDFTQDTFTGRVEYALSPRIGIVGRVVSDHREYDKSPGLSSDGRNYQAGVAFHLTDLLLGEVTVGEFSRDYDSGRKISGASLNADLEWDPTRLTTVNFNARRTSGDNGIVASEPYVDEAVGVDVDHELLRNVILSAGGYVGRRDYQGIDRTDDYNTAYAGVNYLLNRGVALTARVQHDEENSTGINRYRDFSINTVRLGVSLRL